jgi:DNA-binding SARP family transcriptional activator
VAYALELIRAHDLPAPPSDVPGWPWPVVIRTLGTFAIEVDGAPLEFAHKAQRKPLELLKLLVAAGRDGLGIDAATDHLWQPGEGGRNAFDITVHRLRRLLGGERAVAVHAGRVALGTGAAWVDAWSVERTLESLAPAVAALPPVEALAHAAPRILDLYRGPFLADDGDGSWQLARRVRLVRAFQRFAQRLGEHWERERDWRRAEALYQRAVELDPLAEWAYRRQMVCLLAEGRRGEALEAFRRCRQMLSITLGAAPAPETESVYRDVLATRPPAGAMQVSDR